LRLVSNAVSRRFAAKVEAKGVTVAEWVFLRVLYDNEGIAPTVLANEMGMTKGAISKLADRLFEKDLIERETKPDSKRGQILTLRPAARALVPELADLADRNDASFFDVLEPTERQTLERILRKIASAKEMKNIPTE
jgi:DNA-binding MarR family transcriptional regulator